VERERTSSSGAWENNIVFVGAIIECVVVCSMTVRGQRSSFPGLKQWKGLLKHKEMMKKKEIMDGLSKQSAREGERERAWVGKGTMDPRRRAMTTRRPLFSARLHGGLDDR
jgi:hypothetical protein